MNIFLDMGAYDGLSAEFIRKYHPAGIDIARFISENCKKEDYIIAKLNIEGAEYKIIPHLYRCGLIPWVNKWFVQWHWQKIRLSEDYHKYVVSLLPEWHPWECQLSAKKFAPIFLKAL